MQQPLESKGTFNIDHRVFIKYGCSILSGVTLGDTVLGARSVVTRFPACSMIASSPTSLLKSFNIQTKAGEQA